MSTLKVEITKIDEVLPHPNADRLEMARIGGWMCVVQKAAFKAGDLCIYIPIDSVLSADTECKIFPIGSKVTLNKSRIKTIKLRGAVSQGLIVHPSLFNMENLPAGTDVAGTLGITKYEPPAKDTPNHMSAGTKKIRTTNPFFRKYTDIENLKHYFEVFKLGEEVSATEKIHGTNFRCGYVPFAADTLWKKVKAFLRLAPKIEFVYGSRNVQLQNKMFWTGYYDKNVYAKIVEQYALDLKLKENEVVYGEIYGDGIQKNYSYGCGQGEHKLAVFDLMVDGKYADRAQLEEFLARTGLPTTPELYRGPYDYNKLFDLTKGNSVLAPEQAVREGIVVKPLKEEVCYCGRKVLKLISEEYDLGDQSDNH